MSRYVKFAYPAVLVAILHDTPIWPSAAAGPIVVPQYASSFRITDAIDNAGQITQMAWGPDGRLYASRDSGGAVSFQYNAATGTLSDMRPASDISGLGIGFTPGGVMYLSSFDSIWRLTNTSGDGNWGSEPGDTKVAIVTGIPTGEHQVDQIQIQGNTLYVGIGTRTIDGGTGVNTGLTIDDYGGQGMVFGGQGKTFGESAYGGTISWIQDLSKVPSTTGAANVLGPISQATIQTDASPYTSTAVDKLVVHSAGARNPFGLALDRNGNLYFTNNYNRADTNGDGTSHDSGFADAPGSAFSHSVHDQFFKAVAGGDYGYRNDNWRGVRDPSVVAPILDPTNPNHISVTSITPDNLSSTRPGYLQPYDPSHPVGLGPSSSSDGFAFSYSTSLPPELFGNAFIARYTNSITESSPGTLTLTYADLVAVDPSSGLVRQIATGFTDPVAVIADSSGNLIVSDFATGSVYTLDVLAQGRPPGRPPDPPDGSSPTVSSAVAPEPTSLVMGGIASLVGLWLARRSRRAASRQRPPNISIAAFRNAAAPFPPSPGAPVSCTM